MNYESKNKDGISVIVPALNEEKNILNAINNTLKAFDDFNINGEIIVINDGSTDKTEELVNEIIKKDSRIKMFKHKLPQGIGASFWDGVDSAMGEAVVMLPGDNENEPREILRYYKLLQDVDIVVPFILNKKEARSFSRNILSSIYLFIINTTFSLNFNYANGTVLYRKSILKELGSRNKGFFYQTDILVRLVKKGYLFAEVPCRIALRKEGISKAVNFSSLLTVIKGYMRLVKDFYFKKGINMQMHFRDGSLTALRRNNKIL